MTRRYRLALALALLVPPLALSAHAPSGAIFTTLSTGAEVNLNQFNSKEDVWLDGGPGPGAPATAAGLDDGTYVFQVTDPSGAALLSTDAAKCRQVVASGGFFTSVVATGCQHALSNDLDHVAEGAKVVQLVPYLDSPNNGGEYKVWVTRVEDYLLGCSKFNVSNGLDVVDCGNTGGNRHGFINAHSKTDNFKIKADTVREIDVLFFNDKNNNGHRDSGEDAIPNVLATWTDTHGVSNKRYADPRFQWGVYAHVEVPETANGGVHYITLTDTASCKIGLVHVNDFDVARDNQGRVAINVSLYNIDYLVEVACKPAKGKK
jgi:hypothetical protein